MLGRRSYDQSGWWGGALDELQIYNRVLAPEEVTALFERHTCR